MRTEQELKQLAIDIVEGKVFGTWNLRNPEDAKMVFFPFGLMDSDLRDKLVSENVAHFYEYLSKAGERGVNGMPTFFSMNCITEEEMDILQPLIKQLREQKEVFLATK